MKNKMAVLLLLIPFLAMAQSVEERLTKLENDLNELKKQEDELNEQIEDVSLEKIRADIQKIGMPTVLKDEEVVTHSAMSFVYSEKHEQAKWVAHIISPRIIKGSFGRSNDFRTDPKVTTGSAVEEDYFLKTLQPDSSYVYDGFGYDRGHLAPSADFRWSQKALSESYYYSNMAPQVADLNRGKWAELEGVMRGYMYRNEGTQLYVVTGPVLKDDLPIIERSVNKVSIPEQFFKVVLDLDHQRAIGFLMENKKLHYPVEKYAVSIDEIEKLTGIDFFPNLADEIENVVEKQVEIKEWLPQTEQDDVQPIDALSLPKNTFNSVQAKLYVASGDKVTVCGTVVSTKLSSKGNVFLNLDKRFPNQLFTVFIKKEDVVNFSYQPDVELMGKTICVTGEITDFNGTPTMNLKHGKAIEFYDE